MAAEEYFPLHIVGTEEEWDEMMEMETEDDTYDIDTTYDDFYGEDED